MQEIYGLKFFNSDGSLLMEIGPHVVQEIPLFAGKIGEVAAYWAQAEVHLNCLFAVLLNVTPDEAASRLKRYKTAALAAKGARNIAAEYLVGEELQKITEILDKMDLIRLRRNRIQHDVWAKKGGIDDRLFAVHVNQYLDFTTRMLELTESKLPENEKTNRIIELGEEFAAIVTAGYSVGELQELEYELSDLNKSLMSAMFTRLLARKND